MEVKVGDYISFEYDDIVDKGCVLNVEDILIAVESQHKNCFNHNCGGLATVEGHGIFINPWHVTEIIRSQAHPDKVPYETTDPTEDDPFKQQIGGGHYKSMKIQPVEFILANELGFCEGNIVKYTCRYKQKGGIQDLKKVIHYAEMLIAKLEEEGAEF